MTNRPASDRRRLCAELRRAREAAGLVREQVADAMEWSLSKLIRVETGQVGISLNDLRALLDLYGVDDVPMRQKLAQLARTSRQRMWWGDYKDVVGPQLLKYIGFEAEATRVLIYSCQLIPGLFQTDGYARAVIGGAERLPPSPRRLEEWVQVRLQRQRELFRPGRSVEVEAIIDEEALHRASGGSDVMREQLEHLETLATSRNVTICVLAFSLGIYPGIGQPFVLLEFDDAEDLVIRSGGGPGEMFPREKDAPIAHYRELRKTLRNLALSPEASLAMIRSIKDNIR